MARQYGRNFLANAWARVRAAYRMSSMQWNGHGGQGYGWRLLLPGTEYDYEAAAGDLWRNSAVACCLRWYRVNAPEPRLEAVKLHPTDRRRDQVVPQHECVRLLNRPNRFYDRFTLAAAVTLSALVDGNSYLLKIRSEAGRVVELWWIPHWLIWPRWKRDGTQFIGWYDYQVNGQILSVPISDVVHFKLGTDPRDDRRGFSDLKQAVRSVCGLNEADTYTAAIMRNMGVVSHIVSWDGDGGAIQLDDVGVLQDQWREHFTAENRGTPLFSPRNLKVVKLGMSPEEMRLEEIPNRLEAQIHAMVGLSPMVTGSPAGKDYRTYANYAEARKAAYEDGLIPLQKALACCWTEQLLIPDFTGADELRYDYTGVSGLGEAETAKIERVGKAYQVYQVMTRSEARRQLGLEVGPDDDVYFADVSGPAKPDGDDGEGEEPDQDEENGDEPKIPPKPRPRREGEQGRPFERARTPGTPAGDQDEEHEDNTFALPAGSPIRRQIKRFGRRQLKKMLGTLPAVGEPLPGTLPPLEGWNEPMTRAMIPIIGAYWDEAGKLTRARLGLDPDAFEVHDPHLQEMIRSQCFAFCQSTNQTTSLALDDALQQLRDELTQGLVEQSEAIPALRKRVKSVFQQIDDFRADQIARSEASRAVHRASRQSAKESGVVRAKKWLAATNSCDRCVKLEAETAAKPIPIDDEFDHQGHHAEYAANREPPAHPFCRCSLTFVLTEQYAEILQGPDPPGVVQPGSMGPDPDQVKPARRVTAMGPGQGPRPPRFPAAAGLTFEFGDADEARTREQAEALFGGPRSPRQIGSIIGAPDGAMVRFLQRPESEAIIYRVLHPAFSGGDRFAGSLDREDGKLTHRVAELYVRPELQGHRVATGIHGRMVTQGGRLGVERLKLTAARTDEYRGHIAWPLLGYDAALPEFVRLALPDPLRGARTVGELLRGDEGRDWWLDNAPSLDMTFDLDPGGPSMKAWAVYWSQLTDEEREMARKQLSGKKRSAPREASVRGSDVDGLPGPRAEKPEEGGDGGGCHSDFSPEQVEHGIAFLRWYYGPGGPGNPGPVAK